MTVSRGSSGCCCAAETAWWEETPFLDMLGVLGWFEVVVRVRVRLIVMGEEGVGG